MPFSLGRIRRANSGGWARSQPAQLQRGKGSSLVSTMSRTMSSRYATLRRTFFWKFISYLKGATPRFGDSQPLRLSPGEQKQPVDPSRTARSLRGRSEKWSRKLRASQTQSGSFSRIRRRVEVSKNPAFFSDGLPPRKLLAATDIFIFGVLIVVVVRDGNGDRRNIQSVADDR